ncbi:protealysin inhibitor emfourin [Herbiconiux sp. VKM Ac-1786]|uniref:protealysin inhibitor emfourin n=1 Tax=Herbiconiux sp. VKM Ac-1786 TaxID=2783824 RepID=UPI001E3DB723|nr:protealysin inhibitor emfourin [Herbiconiux sp. VKM Ac-1786]
MTDQTPPESAADPARAPQPAGAAAAPAGGGGRELRITVARSGGVAGVSPKWSIEASEENDVDSWLSLVESCPWDAPDPADDSGASGPDGAGASGADRFVYTIRVLVDAPDEPEVSHGARVPEQHLDGPWRDLVDRVKDASRR